MSDAPISVASAVLPPEPQQIGEAVSPSLKRRQSSESFQNPKRRRFGQDENELDGDASAASPPLADRTNQLKERRRNGQLEERKRGQRLFGALLGTLSQSSSSTAHKRRADIEDKQRTKLKEQTEEANELRKVRLDELLAQRRKEQKRFDEQSMRRRHQNILSEARFLKTKAEPHVFYKPWELRPDEEIIVNNQIEEAKELVENELRDYETSRVRTSDSHTPDGARQTDVGSAELAVKESITNGKTETLHSSNDPGINGAEDADTVMGEDSREATSDLKQKETQDEVGDAMEGEEDTVIY